MYRVTTYPEALEQIAALPDEALLGYAEVLGVLTLVPWNGAPLNKDYPSGQVRTLPFGAAGMVTYLILEYDQRVDVITVTWVG
ncbi:MAG: hypothetical protein ACRDTC_11365 [Pseudonocardiaceae bacterium]